MLLSCVLCLKALLPRCSKLLPIFLGWRSLFVCAEVLYELIWCFCGVSSLRKHFSLEAANFSLFSQEGEVTSSLIPGPAWSLRLQFTKYQQRYAPLKFFFFFFFFCNSTYSLYPEHWIIQEPVFVLHLFTCHGRIMPRLAELLLHSSVVLDSRVKLRYLLFNISVCIMVWLLCKIFRHSKEFYFKQRIF